MSTSSRVLQPPLWTRFLASLPLWLLYVIADVLYLGLFRLGGFQRELVRDNLRRSFPERAERDIRRLADRTYRQSMHLLFETIKGMKITRAQLALRMCIDNPGLLEDLLKKYPVVIAATAHYGNWEWLQLACTAQLDHRQITLYKPLGRAGIDQMLEQVRGRFGGQLADTSRPLATLARFARAGGVIALNADQLPRPEEDKYWCSFLNRDTAFFPGLEKLATAFSAPVIYAHTRRTARGRYRVEFELLGEPPYDDVSSGEIMQTYVKTLEGHVRERPEDWVWAYKRWKYPRN